MLTIKHLQVRIGKRILIPDMNAQWSRGSLVAVLGPNGAGKTTLLNHLAGIALKEPNFVFWDSEDIFAMPPRIRASQIASIAQQDETDHSTLVRDRIAHGLFARRMTTRLTAQKESELVSRVASTLGIHDLLWRSLFSLSGGQRKKAHIARALVDDNANVFILDEPDASLDAESRAHLMSVLRDLANKGKLVVVSLHHRELADSFADERFDLAFHGATL